MPELSFDEAVRRVRSEKAAAFAFCPIPGSAHRRYVGANLFVVAHRAGGAESDYCVHYVGGRFGTLSLARESYPPDAVPPSARQARYRLLSDFNEGVLGGDLQAIHRELQRRAEAFR